ncbi:MAG: hypothetical protein K6E95_00515, partial [Lachnospiraceae bacterium]|nr:hypothetical protein [Lachnospiraceae bacterium]
MKKITIFLVSLLASALLIVGFAGGDKAQAGEFKDLLMEEFFPEGLENLKPIAPEYEFIKNSDTGNVESITAYIRMHDQIQNVGRTYDYMIEDGIMEDIEDFGTFNSFEKKYRLQGLDYGVQFDISVDGSDWLYDPNTWDVCDMWDQESIPDGLPVKEHFGLSWHDNLTNMSLLDPSSLNNNPGIMEGCYDEGDDDNWGYIYLDDH